MSKTLKFSLARAAGLVIGIALLLAAVWSSAYLVTYAMSSLNTYEGLTRDADFFTATRTTFSAVVMGLTALMVMAYVKLR